MTGLRPPRSLTVAARLDQPDAPSLHHAAGGRSEQSRDREGATNRCAKVESGSVAGFYLSRKSFCALDKSLYNSGS